MKVLLKKIKKIFWQECIYILIIIAPWFLTDPCIDTIKKIFESWNGSIINEDVTHTIIKAIISLILYTYIYHKNSEKEFFNGDVYGDITIVFYYIARFLGYKKVSLIRKPYDIQFKILRRALFDIVDDNIDKDEAVIVETDKSHFKYSNNMRECNLIIADTYPINMKQIPISKRNLDSILIKRKKSSISPRVYSPKLINEVSESVALIQKTGAKINLFLTTNTKNTEKIVKEIFMKGDRSCYKLEVFLQKSDGSREFREKGIKV